MNPPAKILLAAALLLGAHVRAEFVRQDGAWQVKPGTAADVTPPSRLPVLLLAMDHASGRLDAGDIGGALKEWEIIGEANVGAEAEAISLLTRARVFVSRGEFEKATTIIDDLFARHSGFPGFGGAVELQFDIANRLADGQRRRLGGWFPWFSDRQGAIAMWEKTIRLAPNGPHADDCLIRIARLGKDEDLKEKTNEALERLVSDTTLEAADHWRTLADQFPNDARAKVAVEQIGVLRDRAARARLSLARFYFFNRNNPEAAKLMANACRNIAPESPAAKEAEALLAAMIKDPNPPKTLADRLLGVVPRPRPPTEAKPQAVGEDLDALGFKKEPAKAAVGPDAR